MRYTNMCCITQSGDLTLWFFYYSQVVFLRKRVSQILGNSSFNSFTDYDDGRKRWRDKSYRNALPLYISPLLSFDGSCVCIALVD